MVFNKIIFGKLFQISLCSTREKGTGFDFSVYYGEDFRVNLV